jgi:hypothetical protein
MANQPRLAPENNFPKQAVEESVVVQRQPEEGAAMQGGIYTLLLATSADMITPWGKNTLKRDRELREFWPTEPFLAGGVATVSFRNAAYDWEIQGSSEKLQQAVTDMLLRAQSGDKIGWTDFVKKFSQDLYTTDNGAFIELIRDPGMDANSKFKGPMAPVIGIANLDSNQCQRTGNIETPVLYTDRDNEIHKLKWYEVIPFSEYPSSIERMNGVGYCSVTRALRLAQIMKSLQVFKDEKISGRNPKDINIIGGVSRKDVEDAVTRTSEGANNKGQARYVENVILASLDPEKPVSVATISLASFPEGFDYDTDMQWYIAGLALNFGVDYQEFAPLPSGNIGSSAQSMVLSRKTSGKGPRNWMDSITEGFSNYGVLPRNTKMIFNDKNEQEELERQEVRTKAMEEAAIAANARVFPRKWLAEQLVDRGLYKSLEGIPEDFWIEEPTANNKTLDKGGNTIVEDVNRRETGKPNMTIGDRLRKVFESD